MTPTASRQSARPAWALLAEISRDPVFAGWAEHEVAGALDAGVDLGLLERSGTDDGDERARATGREHALLFGGRHISEHWFPFRYRLPANDAARAEILRAVAAAYRALVGPAQAA